jgi:hypothetical protein
MQVEAERERATEGEMKAEKVIGEMRENTQNREEQG